MTDIRQFPPPKPFVKVGQVAADIVARLPRPPETVHGSIGLLASLHGEAMCFAAIANTLAQDGSPKAAPYRDNALDAIGRLRVALDGLEGQLRALPNPKGAA